jgi:hypothetical protein
VPQQQAETRRRFAEAATLKELAKSYNVGRASISRLIFTSEEVHRGRQEFDGQKEIARNIRMATK